MLQCFHLISQIMRKIVLDIETRNLFQDVGTNNPADLDISVVCIYDYERDMHQSFLQEDFGRLWPILENADMLITYNGDHFDIPLLDKYYPGDLTKIKSLDLLKEIKNSLGRRIKLDTVAEATLGRNKSGHGLEAITWWKNGEIDKIIKYCTEDVRITKEVYDYAMKNGVLKYTDGSIIKDIKLDTSKWEQKSDSSMTFSLGF
ncbi:MAG: helicase [Candidatus Taylorbacteria bacterium CG10_big_fil_rev_8_21_14_0_10_41_48]|uniref:Helicase n=1 Tax=Candidatus Taylorbacteria bacterium CG10_big_fil_rev_8_21_14_0_10_41_48 TaxID=1975024 RepID=A0A2M8LBT7_9BACT|nr:MAG: helicase [Candidatus Taylorbacteria bacterium CG10_big_fil_rev_8_21_14_0_10_41_48]